MLNNIQELVKEYLPFLMQNKKVPIVTEIQEASFSALFPYFSYDPDDGIFVNKNNIGIGFKTNGLLGANLESIKLLLNFFNNISPDREEIYIQCVRHTTHEILDQLDAIEAESSIKGGMYAKFASFNKKYLINMAKKGLTTRAGFQVTLFNTQCYLFISTPYKKNSMQNKIDLLSRIKKQVKNERMFEELSLEDFLTYVQSVVNAYPSRIKAPAPQYNPMLPIADQICKTDFKLRQQEEKLQISFLEHPNHYPNRVHSEIVSFDIETYPESFGLWNIPECFASIRNQYLGIQTPHLFAITFKFEPKHTSKDKASSKVKDLAKYANPEYTKFVYHKRQEYQDWKMMQDFLEQSDLNLTIANAHTSLLLFTDEVHREEHIKQAQDIFTTAGFLIAPKDGAHLFQVLSALPFTAAEGYFNDAQILSMQKTMTNWNAINLLPIVTEWKGCYTGLVCPTPRGQISCLDNFNKNLALENTNIVMAANSGGGKSFLMQAIVSQVLSTNGKVWIFDRGNSYRKTCDLLGGTYINKDSLKLNPFTFLPDDPEDLNLALVGVRDLLASMASGTQIIDDVSQQYLLNAVFSVFKEKGKESTIQDVRQSLEKMYEEQKQKGELDRRILDLSIVLEPYTAKEMYGKYFNEGSLLDPNQNLIVVELGDFDNLPDLQKSILCALIMHVAEEMYHTNRDRPKMCIIDEAWAFLDSTNPIMAKFINTGFRTSRKHRGAFVVITQDYDVFFDENQPLARTAYNCSAMRIILRQNRDRFRQLCQANDGLFSPYEQQIVEGFTEAKVAGFSSFCVKTDSITSFHRLLVDPLTRILFSTEPTQYQQVENLLQQGVSTYDAVYRVAQHEYPSEMALYGDMQ